MRHNQWRYADYDGDGALDLVVGIEDWSYYGWDDAWNADGQWRTARCTAGSIVFRNTGTTAEPNYAEPFFVEADGGRVDTFGCPSPNFADFDGDGDLDLLCGEFLDGFTYFENIGTRTQPRYAAGKRLKDATAATRLAMDLQMIVPVAFDWDRDGDFDLIVGDEDGRVAFVENTGKLGRRSHAAFSSAALLPAGGRHAQVRRAGHARRLSTGTATATPTSSRGNTAGYIEFFENLSGPRVAEPKWAAPRRLEAGGKTFRIMAGPNGSIQGPAEAKWGYTTLNVADWDADGLPDIVLNSIWGKRPVAEEHRHAHRAEAGRAAADRSRVGRAARRSRPGSGGSRRAKSWSRSGARRRSCYDFNGDGLLDLAMLDHEGYLAFFERAKRTASSC